MGCSKAVFLLRPFLLRVVGCLPAAACHQNIDNS